MTTRGTFFDGAVFFTEDEYQQILENYCLEAPPEGARKRFCEHVFTEALPGPHSVRVGKCYVKQDELDRVLYGER